jgi:hypothetical protein
MEKELLENAGSLFEGKLEPKPVNGQNDPDRLLRNKRKYSANVIAFVRPSCVVRLKVFNSIVKHLM